MPTSTEKAIDLGAMLLPQLTERWLEFKQEERIARNQREQIERLILQNIEAKDEGTVSESIGDLTLKVTYKLTRKVDEEKWKAICRDVPEALHPVRTKFDVDTRRLRHLMNNEPDVYLKVSEALEVKPAKPYITVMEAED